MHPIEARIIDEIIAREVGPNPTERGGYTDDPDDPGGKTIWGITEATARDHSYTGDMRDMPRETAERIYSAGFWRPIRGGELAALSHPLAAEVADTAVNCGPGRAGRWLQQALNALNNDAELYPDITVDGAIGPATLQAVRSYLRVREARILVRALDCLQGAYYLEGREKYIYGWLRARVGI